MSGFVYGMPKRPFILDVMKGRVPGHSTLDKFGENPDIDSGSAPEVIWEFGGMYTYSTTADITSLSSSSASDTGDIEVIGLDNDGREVTQTITLQGQTTVSLDTPLWRVYRMTNVGSVDFAGTVYCYVGTSQSGGVPSNDSDVRAEVDNGNNQTLMAMFTVPLGKVGYLYRGEVGMSRNQSTGSAEVAYFSRRYGRVFAIKKRVDVVNQGASTYQDERSFPDVIPALTDIELRVLATSANNVGMFGTFDILLVDEDQLDASYLEAIGQPSSR